MCFTTFFDVIHIQTQHSQTFKPYYFSSLVCYFSRWLKTVHGTVGPRYSKYYGLLNYCVRTRYGKTCNFELNWLISIENEGNLNNVDNKYSLLFKDSEVAIKSDSKNFYNLL